MITENQKNFTTYIRTKQFWQNRFRNVDSMNPVYISSREIQERFFIKHTELQTLVDAKLIEVTKKETTKGHKANYFKALKSGGINPSMLKPKGKELDMLTSHMRNTLKLVSLTDNAPSTPYFDTFLLLKKTNIELFFTIDEFSGRVHTPISSFHRPFRSNILINDQKTDSLDVVTMQPLLLGKILKNQIGENDYSNWINSGEDIYLIIQDKAKLNTRDEAKKRFFEILFSKPNKLLSEMFGNSIWIEWINSFKGQLCKQNPHTLEKNHSNLAWLLQTTEVNMMRKVWQSLKDNGIIFLSVHDEVIIQNKDLEKAEHLFSEILNREFEFYKLSSKVKPAEIEITYNHIKHLVAPADEGEKEITNFLIDKNERPPVTNENWNTEILELETFFNSATLPSQPVKLDVCSTITDVYLFVCSHLATVKANNGNRTYLPYLNRLKELKQLLYICYSI